MTLFDTKDPAFQAHPYPVYEALRREDPVHLRRWDNGFESWILTRYADCHEVLRDPRMSAARMARDGLPGTEVLMSDPEHPVARFYAGMMLFRDPPDHTRLRTLVNKAFTARSVDALRPRIARIVNDLLAPAADTGRIDLIGDFAAILPVVVIAELLGVPAEDHLLLKRWSDQAAHLIDGSVRELDLEGAIRALVEFQQYVGDVVKRRRDAPRDDLVSRLVQAQERDDTLAEHEILGTLVLLLGAGHETTTNLIGNGALALLRHPDQLARLRRDPGLIPSAVEECLRYDSPVQATSRVPLEDMEVFGVSMRRGIEVVTCLGAANRDPAQFPDPDRFDVGRSPNSHLAFGHGIHFCLGAPLARLEGQLAFAGLLHAFESLELEAPEALRWRLGFVLHGLEALPVAVTT